MEPLRTRVTEFQEQEELEISFKSFGRTEMGILEVPFDSLRIVANWLRTSEELRFDWLEFMSVYERKGKVHLSYFLRSQARSESCVLRGTSEMARDTSWLQVPSLTLFWPMLKPYEEEASRLFGIQFQKNDEDIPVAGGPFPLRKSFEVKRES